MPSLDKILNQLISFLKNDTLLVYSRPNALIYIPYPRVNCLVENQTLHSGTCPALDLLTSRAFEREPGPTTPDQKTKRTTLRKSSPARRRRLAPFGGCEPQEPQGN